MAGRASAAVAMTLALTLASVSGAEQAGQRRVTAATNVRLRAAPSLESAIAATLKLGVDLVEVELSTEGQWVRVRTTSGQEGWVSTTLTRLLPPGDRDRVLEEIAAERSTGGFGFDAAAELVALVTDLETRAKERAHRARLALYRIRALKDAADSVNDSSPAERAWLDTHKAFVIHNPPPGTWMLRIEALKAEHDRHRGTPSAEDIAWMVVENGYWGECEGWLPCGLAWWNQLEGWFLRQYPAGPRTRQVMQDLLEMSTAWPVYMDDPAMFAPQDCEPFVRRLETMRGLMASVKPQPEDRELHANVMKSLHAAALVCKKE